jgi:hypothetical protein
MPAIYLVIARHRIARVRDLLQDLASRNEVFFHL